MMFHRKRFDVHASEIAEYLNKSLIGEDFLIKSLHSIKTPEILKRARRKKQKEEGDILLISDKKLQGVNYTGFIMSTNPELDLAYILHEFFTSVPINQVHPNALVSEKAGIGRNVLIGAYSIVGPDVYVGDNSKIFNNVVINGPVTIGKFCIIKDGAVIGSEGWNFIKNEDGIPFHTPQLGQILIEDNVWIGTNSTVERAMIEDTVLCKDVKVDDLVHIGAASIIGQRSEVTAGSIISSNVLIGKDVRIAPNSVIRENISIGNNVIIGQGTVVIEDLPAKQTYVGNPARPLRKNKA